MKQYSPIILFFILIFNSCKERNVIFEGKSSVTKEINVLIEMSIEHLQELDRIKSINKAYALANRANEDSLIYKTLYSKIEIDRTLSQDSLDFYFKRLKKVSTTVPQLGGYFYLRGFNFQEKNSDSSYVNYTKSQSEYLKEGDSVRAGYSLMMMSRIHRISSDYIGAESTLTEAFSYLKPIGNYNKTIYNNFGLIYRGLYDYDKSIEYYYKVLPITTEPQERNVVMNNIALAYIDKKEYNKSIKILDSINSLPSLASDPLMKAKVLSNLGYSIYLSKEGDGLSYLKQAEIIQDSIQDSFGKLANYLKLSDVYQDKNISISKKYALKAYDLAKQLNNGDDKLRALELLSKVTTSKTESDKIFSEYFSLNDSITTARQIKKKQFAKIRYDYSEQEKQALKFKAESAENKLVAERNETRIQWMFAGVFAVIVSVIFFVKSMRKKHILEKLKASYESETRISKKVHDELANDIYNAMSFTGSQDISQPDKKEKLLSDLDSVYKRTRDISKENASIETGERFPLQLKEMLSEYQNDSVNVASRGINAIPWTKMEGVKKVAVYRILQELMVNMAKHSEATIVIVAFKTKGRTIEIDYFDNGIGMPAEKLIFRNGLANAENRMDAIGGRFTFETVPQKGLNIKIIFPV